LGEAALAEAERQAAYQRSLSELIPVSPDEIRDFRQKLDERDEALADSPPRALRTRTVRLSLSPGFQPPVVALTPNLVTALVFLDSSGSAWPVTSSVLGSGSLYRAEILKNDSDNRVIVSPQSAHGNSNLIITLQNHEIPLVIRLATKSGVRADRDADGLIIFQVQGRGPKAGPTETGAASGGPVDSLLYSVLDGVVPSGAAVLKAEPEAEGTTFLAAGGTLYVRTRHSLLWPGFSARVSGPGGWTVYEAPFQSPVLIGLENEIVRAALSAPAAEESQ
jgi:intracellular multiplication protein IcmK